MNPEFPQFGEAPLYLGKVGNDRFNSEYGIITAGPVGDIAFTQVVRLRIKETGWRVLDTESRLGKPNQGEPEWVPLRRNCVAIVPRIGKPPIVFKFDREGKLDMSGLHFSLSGENLGLAVTHVAKAVLEALGWLPKEEKK